MIYQQWILNSLSGASLYEILEASSKRIVVIVSADLAHTHLASGPYGYSNTSEPFDQVWH